MNINDTVPALPDVRKEWTQHPVWALALAGIKPQGALCVRKSLVLLIMAEPLPVPSSGQTLRYVCSMLYTRPAVFAQGVSLSCWKNCRKSDEGHSSFTAGGWSRVLNQGCES